MEGRRVDLGVRARAACGAHSRQGAPSTKGSPRGGGGGAAAPLLAAPRNPNADGKGRDPTCIAASLTTAKTRGTGRQQRREDTQGPRTRHEEAWGLPLGGLGAPRGDCAV